MSGTIAADSSNKSGGTDIFGRVYLNLDALFYINAVLFGIGLAMDAFTVSMANGLNEPRMRRRRMYLIAGTFAGFQIAMPLIGWICVHTIARKFEYFNKATPWIALILLLIIGGKMLAEGIKNKETEEAALLGIGELIVQGIATSIDALSVGFTTAHYNTFPEALTEALIIGVVTFGICMAGIFIGRKAGMLLAGKAKIAGGIILIAIGVKIFISSLAA